MEKIDLFRKLISILEHNVIPYAVVGRTEDYPLSIGSDVDIVIPRNKIDDFHRTIWEIEDNDTKIVQMIQHEIVAFYYVVFSFYKNRIVCIQPDVCTDYYRKGRMLLEASYLLKGRREARQGGFKVLASEKEFIYYLLKKIDKTSLNKEQFDHIKSSYDENKSAALEEAKIFWDMTNVDLLRNAFETNDYSLLNKNIKRLQKGIHQSHQKRFVDNLKTYTLKIKRILNPTGYVIGVMGPDGSGKTTVINQLRKDIHPAFRRLSQYHFFPKKVSGIPHVDNNPQGKTKRPFLLSVLKLFYFVVLYNAGWLKLIVPQRIKSTFVIFDRYYQDILIDPLRYRNGTPAWIVKAIGWLIPNPSLWIVLDAPTGVIQARKAEVTPEETERQRQKYIAFANSMPNALLVDTNHPVQEISCDISRFISQALNRRTINRYKK